MTAEGKRFILRVAVAGLVMVLAIVVYILLIFWPVDRADLVGTYRFEHGWKPGSLTPDYRPADLGHEELVLMPNGTFLQTYVSPKGVKARARGTWKPEFQDGWRYIELRDLMEVLDERGHATLPPPRWGTYLPLTRSWGRVVISVDDDLGYRYVRVGRVRGKE